MSSWEERMEARHARPRTTLPPDEPPPDDGPCGDCYEWRRYAAPQEHFGWAWWRICGPECAHEHHRDEVRLASG